MIKRYIEYLKDNPKGYWFRAKWFGWGWTPATWQGLLVIIIYICIVTIPGILLADSVETGEEFMKLFLPLTVVSTAVVLWICYIKGEKPRWSWGPPKKKK